MERRGHRFRVRHRGARAGQALPRQPRPGRRGGRPRHRPGRPNGARSSGSSVRTAPARPRPCGCCAPCCRSPTARPLSPGSTCGAHPAEVRRRIGVALQDVGLDPTPDRPRTAGAAVRAVPGAATAGEVRRAARAGRAVRGGRPDDQDLLRRHEAPAGPGDRTGARAAGALPGRADDRSGPGQPDDRVGRGPPHQRGRNDGLPHDAVPRGGRPAVRPDRDHRRRPARLGAARRTR